MKQLNLIFIFLILISGAGFAGKANSSADAPILIMSARIDINKNVKNLSTYKVDAALNLICLLTKKYKLIPSSAVDSVSRSLKEKGVEQSVANISKELKASKILFIGINQLKNILRAEISIINIQSPKDSKTGKGFSFINYRETVSDQAIYDPSLLKALQRAFAVAEGDSSMFAEAKGNFNVIPAKTLVIGGLVFEDDKSLGNTWELFDKKGANSFDAVETIFSTAKYSEEYVVYDTETRDALYALFNIYLVENFSVPTPFEIETLQKLEVQSYIYGSCRRTPEGAKIELDLYDISNGRLILLGSAKCTLEEDSLTEYRKKIQYLAENLLGLE